jgi:hydroxyacylglutathione hydrolase
MVKQPAKRDLWRIERRPGTVVCIPVLTDNYVYLVCAGEYAVAIDAGAVDPVMDYLETEGLRLANVLLTHGHGDHAAGFEPLRQAVSPDAPAYAPGPVEMLALPGHTADDVGFYFPRFGVVFTGDCLINGACGRVFGGTMADLFHSLQKIKALPGDTLVMGGHDYLEGNLRFGLHVEPGNAAIEARLLRYASDPSRALFVTLEEEIATNPFLRAPDVVSFEGLRKAKDRF